MTRANLPDRLIGPPPLLDASVGALRAASDSDYDDQTGRLVDRVDHSKLPDPDPPEIRIRELGNAGWPGIEARGENRGPQRRGVPRWEAAQLALGSWR